MPPSALCPLHTTHTHPMLAAWLSTGPGGELSSGLTRGDCEPLTAAMPSPPTKQLQTEMTTKFKKASMWTRPPVAPPFAQRLSMLMEHFTYFTWPTVQMRVNPLWATLGGSANRTGAGRGWETEIWFAANDKMCSTCLLNAYFSLFDYVYLRCCLYLAELRERKYYLPDWALTMSAAGSVCECRMNLDATFKMKFNAIRCEFIDFTVFTQRI